MAWTTPKTWTAAQILTAFELNEQVRDNLLDLDSRSDDLDTGVAEAKALDKGLRQLVTFTADGTFTKADYSWLRGVLVKVQAGGGGGGSSTGGSGQAAGGGGGGGGYAERWLDASELGASVAVTVGSGGDGASLIQTAGQTGGVSSFAALAVANGGSGGSRMTNTTGRRNANGGAGGSAVTGDVTINGGRGVRGRVIEGSGANWGSGGPAVLGHPSPGPSNIPGGGFNAPKYGGGGGGASATSDGQTGGNGGDGIVIVELFS